MFWIMPVHTVTHADGTKSHYVAMGETERGQHVFRYFVPPDAAAGVEGGPYWEENLPNNRHDPDGSQ